MDRLLEERVELSEEIDELSEEELHESFHELCKEE